MSSSSSSSSRFNNRSSTQSDPSSSTDLTKNRSASMLALTKSRSTRNDHNLSAMVKKFMVSSSTKQAKPRDLLVTTTLISDDFKKKTAITTGFKNLFAVKSRDDEKKKKNNKNSALPEARTLATVLRSERELLSRNKEQETEIHHLNSMLHDKNKEVDTLKDLCLKQREEIKALKSAILFPDREKQQEEEEVKQIIPTLQRQVTSLTSQLLYLAKDLAEVKADKYSVMGCYEGLVSSPRTPTTYEQEEATNSVDFSSTTPGTSDDIFLNDLNPCLTPYANSKSKSKEHSSSYNNISTRCDENDVGFGAQPRNLSKSSTSGKILGCENICIYGKHQNILHC